MYYQNYEDYMRSVLGYPTQNCDTYPMNYFENTQKCMMPYQNTKELEDCYPEIYKIINPIVCEACDRCNRPITRDTVDNIVEEVYKRIEINNEIAIKINIDNRKVENRTESRVSTTKLSSNRNINNEQARKTDEIENRQRRPRNPFLSDLIRILILNRLLGGGFFLGNPPRPRPPMKPPFSGGPRPPINRDYDDFFKF